MATGIAADIARQVAILGASAQLVAKVGDDALGDGVLAALARDGVGHVAVIRDAAQASPDEVPVLDGPDIELALRYLADFRVLVAVDLPPGESLDAAGAAASFVDAHSIVLVADRDRPGPDWAGTVLVRPSADPDGAFARLVAGYAAGLDGGREAGEAFAAAVDAGGWEPAGTPFPRR